MLAVLHVCTVPAPSVIPVNSAFGHASAVLVTEGYSGDGGPATSALLSSPEALAADTEEISTLPIRGTMRGNHDSGRITILVSHRFSTVRMADLIVVLDGARLVEIGTHEELMARNGQYSELYRIQAAAYR